MRRFAALLVVAVFAFPAIAQRRRAVAAPSFPAPPLTEWLDANAHPLTSTELVASSSDLEPLRTMVGNATIVGLGDGTHGTHEFETVKLRVIDFLVRELGFEAVAFEAPFPRFEKLNAYVLGGRENPREVLAATYRDLGYVFWNTQEILDVVEWMRSYNAQRGSRPPVQISGFDMHDQFNAANNVVAYLAPIDPAQGAAAKDVYFCIRETEITAACRASLFGVVDQLTASRDELVARSSARAFEDAVHNASIVANWYRTDLGVYREQRDYLMAQNALWLRDHRTASGKIILWAHQEHIGKTRIEIFGYTQSMGLHLARSLGENYFAIGTCAWTGSFVQWPFPLGGGPPEVITSFRPASPDSYEALFRSAGLARILIPLRGILPDALHGPREYRTGPASSAPDPPSDRVQIESLPRKLDAMIFIEDTTPVKTLPVR